MTHEAQIDSESATLPYAPAIYANKTEDDCIHYLFEQQVARTPDTIALLFKDQLVTYRELNSRANQVAYHLKSLGVGPEVAVGLVIERSPMMLVGLLGILKAGGTFVPLDPAYPQERLDFMINDAQLQFLLTQQSLCEIFSAHPLHLMPLDFDWHVFKQYATIDPPRLSHAENLAYMIYTSGSTGKPKGVEVPQRGLCNLIRAFIASLAIQADDRVLQFASLSFDAAIPEIFMALISGATLVLANKDALLPGPPLIQTLQDTAVTTVIFPPSALAVLPDAALPTLQNIMSAGEACTVSLVARWGVGRNFFNGYGPTEATVCATLTHCDASAGNPPLGQALPHVQVYVLDADLQPVPVGTPGELYISGIGVVRGYHKRPELTAASFLPNPWSQEAGARLYKTGDLACYRQDGQLEFLGRSDWQVKYRGFRIELGEIETALCTHPQIETAVVLLRTDNPGEPLLVAYTIADVSPWELRALLKATLPAYMLPDVFVTLEAWPLTPNGKIDRSALPAPDAEKRAVLKRFVAPRTLYEEQLAAIWSEVLHLKHVGIYDPFFELGGHSLQATRVVARVREVFQIELPLDVLFRMPTIAEVAAYLEESSTHKQYATLPTLVPLVRTDDLPLSFSQEQIWFLQQLNPTNLSYNAQIALRLTGPLDQVILQHSLHEIVRRHEIFRTTFPTKNGQPVQVIHDTPVVDITVRDLRQIPAHERQATAERLMYQELQKAFDINVLPLVRWTLLRLDEEEHILVHVEHHLVHDGWSFTVFFHELRTLYNAAFSPGDPSPLPELPLQFADFALWQRHWMEGEEAQAQLTYWREKLAGSPAYLALPTDRSRPAAQRFQGAIVRVELPLPLCNDLRALCLEESKTLYMAMLSAFLILLYRYSNQTDLCIGAGIANRRWRETETLIGMIINMLVLRSDLSGNPSFLELLERVQETTLGAYVHQDLPFSKVVQAVRPERSLSYMPLYQVAFSFHDALITDFQWRDVQVELIEGLSNKSSKFDMNLIVVPQAERRGKRLIDSAEENITLIWEYDTDLFDESTIQHMAKQYQHILTEIVADPGQCIDDISLLTTPERQQLLKAWNTPATSYPREQSLPQLFEEQVARTPDAFAVLFDDERLTYRELNQRANQLAHVLRRAGVTRGTLVGTLMERSLDLCIGFLAILKAGGAYVPLDLAYPEERLTFMLVDAQISVLLTQAQFQSRLSQSACQVIAVDTNRAAIAQESTMTPACETNAEDLAYVIYTSGSTGQPKGVAVPQRAISRLVCQTNYAQINSSDRVAQISNTSFDAVTFEIWAAWLNGGQLIGIPREISLDPNALARALQEQRISTLFLTTALFNQIARETPDAFRGIRQLCFGGEAVDPRWVKEVLAHGAPERLVHVYGPTESTTFAAWYLVQEVPDRAITLPIGGPVSNTTLYVLDQQLQPTAVGLPGELYIGGDGLAWGYLGRPYLTAERFLPHPFSAQPGMRLYKTGDIVCPRTDGKLVFLGRNDQQIKIRGFRIELGEIETTLCQHPAVKEAVVVAHESTPGNTRLIAYVVTASGQPCDAAELQRFLKAHVPEYMLPTLFIPLQTVPLTANGKLDRNALPSPETFKETAQQAYVAARTPVEETLVQIWEEVFGMERIGIHDNFFTLGGHSLLATQVVSRIRKAFQVDLPVRSLFEAPTIAELGPIIVTTSAEAVDSATFKEIMAELALLFDQNEQQQSEEK